jgi:hypothetical protein
VSLVRLNPKRDKVERECMSYLKARGALVIPLSGKGLPDLLVGWRGRWGLIECKSAGGHLTESQEEFFEHCEHRGLPVAIAFGMDDCKRFLDDLRNSKTG